MEKNNKLLQILRFVVGIIIFGVLGYVYFIGITYSNFEPSFTVIYRGLGCAMVYPLYFLLIPTYVNKAFTDIRYSGAMASAFSFILTVVLLLITFWL